MSQLDLDLGELDIMPAVRHVVDRAGAAAVAELLGMDESELSHAINRVRRGDGRRKRIIPIDAVLKLARLPGGEEIARVVAEAAGLMVAARRAARPEESVIAWQRVIETELGGETRKGLLRAHRREEEKLVAESQLALDMLKGGRER